MARFGPCARALKLLGFVYLIGVLVVGSGLVVSACLNGGVPRLASYSWCEVFDLAAFYVTTALAWPVMFIVLPVAGHLGLMKLPLELPSFAYC